MTAWMYNYVSAKYIIENQEPTVVQISNYSIVIYVAIELIIIVRVNINCLSNFNFSPCSVSIPNLFGLTVSQLMHQVIP